MRTTTRQALAVLAAAGLFAVAGSANAAKRTTVKSTVKKKVTTAKVVATVATTSAPATTAGPATTAAPTTAAKPAENTASDVGVTKDTIRVVALAADLGGLVRAGFIKGVYEDAPVRLIKRFSYYADRWNAAGGINGRKVVTTLVTWNPVDPRSFDAACQKITLDIKPFMVVNVGGGYPADSFPCIAGDGDTITYANDAASAGVFKASKGNLFTAAPPAEISAAASAQAAIAGDYIPKSARIGFLRPNTQVGADAYEAARKVLDAAGYKIVFSDAIQTLGLDTPTQNQNVRLAVPKMQDAGVTQVVNMLAFTAFNAFPDEAKKSGFNPRYTQFEIGPGQCTAFSATQGSPTLDGATCATAFDNFRMDTSSVIAKDTPFEAQCRKDTEEFTGLKTSPGIPFGSATLKDVDGNSFQDDQAYLECGWAYQAKAALDKAGANLTKKTFKDALYSAGEHPVAGFSNGKGLFAADKPFEATAIHYVVFTAGDPKASKLQGLYGKCLVNSNCYRTLASAWVPITDRLK